MIPSALVLVVVAYWGPNHSAMNKDVIDNGKPFDFKRATIQVSTLNTYMQRVLYISKGVDHVVDGVKFQETPDAFAATNYQQPGDDKPTDAPNEEHSLLGWAMKGGIWEDGFNTVSEATQWGGLRAVNHFHDPLAGEGGYTGIRTATGFQIARDGKSGRPYLDLLRKGKSVTAWVLGGAAPEKNEWGYLSARDSFRRFYSETDPKKRRAGLGNAMRALGQVMHLIEDNTVPDHARDLAHPGDGWEEHLKGTNEALFGNTPGPWRVMPLKKIEESGMKAFWDRDVYTGVSPVPTVADPVGIDEFVQANFLAWNVFTVPWKAIAVANTISAKATPPRTIEFTTIPPKPGVGYANYRWPQLGVEQAAGVLPSASPSLPLDCIAVARGGSEAPKITAPCWKNWELPLMRIAHGYAQSVLTLAFPQGRAELALANNTSGPVDARKWQLRVWNLGTGENAVTWHVDSAKLQAVLPEAAGPMKAPLTLANVSGDIPPDGMVWESSVFTLTAAEQGQLNFMSHSVVVLEGSIGAGDKKTPFVFGLPIPNGLPLVMQQTTHIVPGPGTVIKTSPSTCCQPMQCTACGENTEVHQPLEQKVMGKIVMKASEIDLLGDPADDIVTRAQKNDARIAGVALVAYPQVMQPYYQPTQPATHTLTLNDNRFTCQNSTCRRNKDAVDTRDPDFNFEFTLKLKEVMAGAMAPPLAAESVYLFVWTTAGAIVQWPVLLWPMYANRTADEIVADYGGECGHATSRALPGAEAAGGCYSGLRMPSCGGGTHENWTRQIVMGPIVGLSTKLSDIAFFLIPGLPKVVTLAGVPPIGDGTTCAPPMYSGGSGTTVCVSNGNSFIIKTTVDLSLPGPCPSIPAQPPLDYSAQYEGSVKDDAVVHFQKLFGHTSYPKWPTYLD